MNRLGLGRSWRFGAVWSRSEAIERGFLKTVQTCLNSFLKRKPWGRPYTVSDTISLLRQFDRLCRSVHPWEHVSEIRFIKETRMFHMHQALVVPCIVTYVRPVSQSGDPRSAFQSYACQLQKHL